MTEFLKSTDDGAFVDWQKKPIPAGKVECAECKGHGGWNLQLNAYSLHDHADTAENRHLFSHFRCHCMNCNGWGAVEAEQGAHVHTWEWSRNTGNCLNEYKCSGCGRVWEIDSSD